MKLIKNLKFTNKKVNFTFNPHLIPTYRGILSSIYVKPQNKINIYKITNFLKIFYKNKKFIQIKGIHKKDLGTNDVLNTNKCEISICQTRFQKKWLYFLQLII